MELLECMLGRRSIRKYNNKDISDNILHCIIEAGLLSPSSRNLHPAELVTVKDKTVLTQLARSKTAGSGMLKNAKCAIVVIGDKEKSDAWIEDCSLSMIYMQLRATELGIANCWVQCRNRISQQDKNKPLLNYVEDIALNYPTDSTVPSEKLVAEKIAASADENKLSSDQFVKQLLGIPNKYGVLSILALGMTDEVLQPHKLEKADFSKVHKERY